jgi:uncharacterized protein YbjT (DUF2867 family)
VKVFVTGATGYLGSGVVRELTAAGHEVLGLTRMAGKASYLEGLGVRPVVADLRDTASWGGEAREADALVHLAAEDSDARASLDRTAVEALVAAGREGRARVLVYTSGCFVMGETGDEPVGEDGSTEAAPEMVAWRPAHEDR